MSQDLEDPTRFELADEMIYLQIPTELAIRILTDLNRLLGPLLNP